MPNPSRTGQAIYDLAATKKGQAYSHIPPAPKDNPAWIGPWDCAELVSWTVYQLTGKLYGCISDQARPAVADAYSGAWMRDVQDATLTRATQAHAMQVPGTILIRKPTLNAMGHVAIADGKGGTIEAAGKRLGVTDQLKVTNRLWDAFALIPGVTYASPSTASGGSAHQIRQPLWLTLKTRNLKGPAVLRLQKALVKSGFDPGVIDGVYGPHTHAAVLAFQAQSGLVVDGWVGPSTASALGI
jgi:N-acetylmuramoyl-L-alanine amidase